MITFKRIWNDPVGSKVISTIIIAGLTSFLTILLSVAKGISIKETIIEIYNFKVSIIFALGALMILLLFASIVKKLIANNKSNLQDSYKAKILAYDNFEDTSAGIKYRWKVILNDNDDPKVVNLIAFCTKHNSLPLKLVNNKCTQHACTNGLGVDLDYIKNYIESELIQMKDGFTLKQQHSQ